ncbi:MAG: type I glyceraldehyde-3-phosphate dehydrogenase [Candidatus Phytoplasma stylosanthis]|uniref:type I glyceraldehyde-3-phosphate dehydrogenase n=1 Tax=Candidatus Phytoplasma stylosanthis TaxID=2798314 RepID=UPI00293AB05E|nr:type I glyceraldehyde-3-phosphate dehydrogenase [Candidatus Phytoplasma stylosanthis]MDV3167937.1 type I glyceraldehyde-3-phosphate dehydrogenase [Candidatus Phytoplasma stylosanthis]MDV3171030.1 type I glyceraldehyde-3-phosphate dehydrogenase [Candidatus Phytoplasma stylosanthis]MDV3173842.1 type I glyceraldehyde-3-phosphate dehydrogenase [Candidatus Phytoplasma stylosanthis]MDV3174248.1 type I glyceraldehyde-3-phosphate dehydrogenase [Candidatus Phytoplasma stylosanthis]MDV3202695.1 type 
MKTKVAINGLGRIGKLSFRSLFDNPNIDIVAVNDLASPESLAYLLKYDTIQGSYKKDKISFEKNYLIVDGKKIIVFQEKNPQNLPWKNLEIDIVLECTGLFTSEEKASLHLEAGAKKVLISAPATGKIKTIVYNVNDNILNHEDVIISGASCTTNCLAPIIKVLNDNFGINQAFMTTVHSYTNDQSLIDQNHPKGIWTRRGRAAAANMVPTSTGAAKAIELVIPELKGKIDGTAIRVPNVTGSLIDLTAELNKEVNQEMINNAFKKNINQTLAYVEDPIVSSDIIGTNFGSLYDSNTLQILKDKPRFLKLIAWYDNEMSYVSQLSRLLLKISNLI